MNDTQRLLNIEEIKKLKARYFYHIDLKNWEGWRQEVFAPDASMHMPEAQEEPIKGVENIISWVREISGEEQTSIHHGFMPDIEIISSTEARGIWAMEDILMRPKDKPSPYGFTHMHGYGHYHDTYTRGPNGWRIQSTKLVRLHVDIT